MNLQVADTSATDIWDEVHLPHRTARPDYESCCKARTFILEVSHVHKGQDDRKDQAHNSKNAEEARPLEDDPLLAFQWTPEYCGARIYAGLKFHSRMADYEEKNQTHPAKTAADPQSFGSGI